MNGLIEAAGALLDPRRLAAAWVPVVAFLIGLGGIVVGALGPTDALAGWTVLGGAGQAAVVACVLLLSVVVAGVVDARRVSATRLLEGYLPPWMSGLATGLARKHERARADIGADDPPRRDYPQESAARPTRIGNVIAAAEEHGVRYGLDAVSTWTRLYPSLPEPFVAAFGSAAGTLHAMSTLCLAGVVFAGVGGMVAVLLLPWWGTALTVLVGVGVAVAAYRGAARAAVPYAELVRAAYDVHRWLLLDAMGLRRPTGLAEERRQWEQLRQLWTVGEPDSGHRADLRYPQPDDVRLPSPLPPPPPPTEERATSSSSSSAAPPPERRVGIRARLAIAALLVIAALSVLTVVRGELWTVVPGHGNELRATRQLPAYGPLSCEDIADGKGPTSRAEVVGRHPLRTIRLDDQVPTTGLGPVVGKDALAGRVVTTVATTTTTAAGAVPRGTRVAVARVPVAPDPAQPSVVNDLLVLDVLATAPTQLVVAIPVRDVAACNVPARLYCSSTRRSPCRRLSRPGRRAEQAATTTLGRTGHESSSLSALRSQSAPGTQAGRLTDETGGP